MDEAQILALLKQTLADAGVSDLTTIRKVALELAVENLSPPPGFVTIDMDTIAQRTREAWGLDYATILNQASVDYADTTLTAPQVLSEIANNITV